MKPDWLAPDCDDGPFFSLGGGAAPVRIRFVGAAGGDPLAPYPQLRLEGRPYNHWLTAEVLERFLARWAARNAERSEVAAEVEASSERARMAYAQVLPASAREGAPAILAALAVTANLLRSLSFLGEALASGHVEGAPPWPFSREWCGLFPPSESRGASGASGRGPAGRPRADRRPARELAAALACSPEAVEAASREAVETLRREIRRCGLFTADDLRQLQAIPPGTRFAQENRSGVVRLRKSSM